MASIQPRAGKWQIRVKHKLLPKPFFSTFDTEDEARTYAQQLENLLDRGIVPFELLEPEVRGQDPLLSKLLAKYRADAPVAPTDVATLELLEKTLGTRRISGVTAAWADSWVADMKQKDHLAPGTIRKRVGSLARAIDWHLRQTTPKGAPPAANALRLLPRGYSQYSDVDAGKLGEGLEAKRDVERDRRLHAGEEQRIRAALAGEKRQGRERTLAADPAFALLFDLIVQTGVRLSEAFRLRVDQVDVAKGVLRIEGSKGERGKLRPRVVPIGKGLREALGTWCRDRVGRVFPFWDGSLEDKRKCTNRLSHRFSSLFDYAQVSDFSEHDLRHEATCRWFEMRGAEGRWLFSEIEVCKIMGWRDTRMALRYASLRGEDLSARMG